MQNTNKEKAITYLFLAIIVVIIAFVIIMVLFSNNNLNNNKIKENNTNIYNNNDSSNNTSESTNISKPIQKDIQISTYTTTIYDKDENRVHNIALALQKLNNTIVNPGEEFSFNGTIGSMDESRGYKKALGFDSNGKKIQISGGGLCQLSSTLYNTILIANLEVTERHAHSKRVAYVPIDKDATIVYGSLDLKFINNTEYPIKITGTNDNNNVTITLYKIENSNTNTNSNI